MINEHRRSETRRRIAKSMVPLDLAGNGPGNRSPPDLLSSIAQLVEHAAVNRRVVGSSPTWGARAGQFGNITKLAGFFVS